MPQIIALFMQTYNSHRAGHQRKHSSADRQKGHALVEHEYAGQVRAPGSEGRPGGCRSDRKRTLKHPSIPNLFLTRNRQAIVFAGFSFPCTRRTVPFCQNPSETAEPYISSGPQRFCSLPKILKNTPKNPSTPNLLLTHLGTKKEPPGSLPGAILCSVFIRRFD